MAAIEKITSERYLELLKIYRRQCGGDIQEAAGKMLLGCISEKARDIKVSKYHREDAIFLFFIRIAK